MEPLDHRDRDARLRLAAVRERPVQVDAVRVQSPPHVVAVRVQVRQQPQILVRVRSQERVHDDEPLAFVAVDASDHEHTRARTGAMKKLDRPVLRRPPDHGGNG
jgi:hypothetical protein